MLSFAVGIFALAVIETFRETNSTAGGIIVGYIFSTILAITAIKQFFLDKARNYKISIDKDGIRIDELCYKWTEIYETAIMTKGAGRGSTKYLLIALSDMSTYEKFELKNFLNLNFFGFSMTLARYIEYFKPSKTTNYVQHECL